MRMQMLTRQLIAFLAAAVIVFTGLYIVILWRNQSATRVLALGAGKLLYQTADFAIGVAHQNAGKTTAITLLRFSPDGGWVTAGSGRWIAAPAVKTYAKVMLLPDESDGPAGGVWFCALRASRTLTAIQLFDPAHPRATQTFSFHNGGVIEPAIVSPTTVVRGLNNQRILFTTPAALTN